MSDGMRARTKGEDPGYMVLDAEDYVMSVCARCAAALKPGDYVAVGGERTRNWRLHDPSENYLGISPVYGEVCSLCDRRF